jgi:hypothetical protein
MSVDPYSAFAAARVPHFAACARTDGIQVASLGLEVEDKRGLAETIKIVNQ